MADAIIVSGPISGTDKTLSFETGKLAFQSQGAVVAKIAGTEALVTANAAKGVRDGIDFFPLTVDVEERMYAAGRIPGSFFRREGRPTDAAILACRLIDRPLRPSFADGFRNETQVVVTVMGSDRENPYDVLAINGASAALSISGIPFQGPIGAVRIAYSSEGTWIPHPTFEEVEESTFELIVAGRGVGDDVAIMMVEAGGTEKAWDHYEAGAPKVTEEVIADGLETCKVWIKESIDLQNQLVEQVQAGRGITPLEFTPMLDYQDDVKAKVEALVGADLAQAGTIAGKAERNAATDAAIAQGPRRAPRRVRGAREGDQGGGPLHPEGRHPQAHRRGGRPHRRSWPGRPAHGHLRGRRAQHGPRHRPVPAGRDPGAQRPHPRHAEDGPAARQPGRQAQEALHAPLQHAAPRQRRDRAAWAARSDARSATASSPSGRCCRWSPPSRSGPTRSAWCPRC